MRPVDLATALDPVLLSHRIGIQPDDWQAEVLRTPAPQVLLLCARQTGKSTTTSCLALHEALFYREALVLCLSASQRQAGELLRKIRQAHSLCPLVPSVGDSAMSLELANGSRVVALPGRDDATIRGYSGARLIIVDEAARVPDPLYQAVRPMLAASQGRLIGLTTPWGKRGWFWDEWEHGEEDWLRMKRTVFDCPRIPAAWLERERRRLPDFVWRQEYLCEFVDTTDQFFSTEHVLAALDPDLLPLFGDPSCRSTTPA